MSTLTFPRAKTRFSLEQLLIALLLGFFSFFILLVIAFLGFQLLYLGRIYPGVSVAGIDLSGLNQGEASARILQQVDYPQKGRLLFMHEEQR